MDPKMFLPGLQTVAAYDLDSNRILLPEHIRNWPDRKRRAWMKRWGIVPAIEGGAYSMFEMMQPFGMIVDGTAVTAAAETILAPAPILTLPANFFSLPGKTLWLHANGILSSVVTTPGTFTFRARWGAGVVGDTLLMASGALAPDIAAHTSAAFYIDLWLKCTAQGPLATALSLAIHGKVSLSSSDVTLAAQQAQYMPAGNATQAIVTGLDGTIGKTLTLTVQPSLATGSVSLRDAQLIAMN